MRWDLLMILDDSSLPVVGSNGWWDGSAVDCSHGSFSDLVDGVWDALSALLPDRIDGATLELVVSERFPDQVCIGNEISTDPHAWSTTFDAKLSIQSDSATDIRAKLASDPNAGGDLQRKWRRAAAEAITAMEDIGLATELLEAVRSLQQGRVPGAQCFNDYNDGPGIFDCRRHIAGSNRQLTGGNLILVELEIREER